MVEIPNQSTDAKTYKGNDIDSDGDGVLDIAAIPASSSSPVNPTNYTLISLALGTWRTPSANNPVIVQGRMLAATDGTTRGRIYLNIDESGGNTMDYIIALVEADVGLGNNGRSRNNFHFILPKGASYQFENYNDPTGDNRFKVWEEEI